MQDILSKEDFAELSARVQKLLAHRNWFQKHGYEILFLFVRLACFAGAYAIFSYPHWIAKVVGMVLLSYFMVGIALTGTHETSHQSFFGSKFFNKAWAFFFSDFWAAQSHLWWHYRHVQVHHLYPNVPSKEPKPFYYPWINKYVYFFVVPYLVEIWMVVNSVKFLWKKWGSLLAYLVVMLAGVAFHSWLFYRLGYSVAASLGLMFLMRSLFGPLFMHIAVFNHIGLDNPPAVLPWLPRQNETTRNVKPTFILTGLAGNAFLQCHIEHHLFPSFSHHLLKEVSPVVRQFMDEKGYKYRNESYWWCLKNCLNHYHEIFDNRAEAVF